MAGAVTGTTLGSARRAAGVPVKTPGSGGISAAVQISQFINVAAGTLTVPAGAVTCEVICAGSSGGGGSTAAVAGARAGSGGGGAFARSRFPVSPGQALSYSTTLFNGMIGAVAQNGADGSTNYTTSVSYGGNVVCQADGGYGGKGVSTANAIGVDGLGGQPSACVGNVEIRAGQAGNQIQGGGLQAPSVSLVGLVSSAVGALVTASGGGSGVAASGNTTAGGGGGSGGFSGTGASAANGGRGAVGVIIVFFYSV